MENQKFKTKRELAEELGLSKSSFYRMIQKKEIATTPEMISPKTENELRVALGFPPLPGFEAPVGTHWDPTNRFQDLLPR